MTKAIEEKTETINRIIHSLVKIYNPLEIYIFGSYAWGTPDSESDIDFAVIIEKSNLDMAKRIRLATDELWDIEIPTDILVYTKNEIQEKAKYISTLQYRIITEGTKIYEAA